MSVKTFIIERAERAMLSSRGCDCENVVTLLKSDLTALLLEYMELKNLEISIAQNQDNTFTTTIKADASEIRTVGKIIK